MSRIFKGSRYQLQLLITSCSYTIVENIKIKFFTTDPNSYVETTENIALNGNIATVTISSNLFDGLDEGLLTYEISGLMDGIHFTNERQSTYFLKNASPLRVVEQKQTKQIFVDLNGTYFVDPDEGYSALERVVVEVNVPQKGNLEERHITPNTENVNADNLLVVTTNEGYDGMSKVVLTRTMSSAPLWMQGYVDGTETTIFKVSQKLVGMILTSAENLAVIENRPLSFDNIFEHLSQSPNENTPYVLDFGNYKGVKSISNMYTQGHLQITAFYNLDCSEVEDITNAFNAFTNLRALYDMYELGKNLTEGQTLDLSMTHLSEESVKILVNNCYDFKLGPNAKGVTTAYYKGPYPEYFEARGWTRVE